VTYDANDVRSMALCIWKEARGEGGLGMQAVGNVIRNRIGAPGFPGTLHDVIYEKNQFTSMSVPSDPEFNLQPSPGDAQFDYCMNISVGILENSTPETDPTHGALYYCNLVEATSGWFARNIVNNTAQHPQVAAIGKQLFYL